MTGDDRLGDAVVVKRRHFVARRTVAALPDPPRIDVDLLRHIFLVAADEERQLQQSLRPEIAALFAEMPAGVGEGQRMREIEPGDVVGDGVLGRAFDGQIEMQEVPCRRTQ